MKILDYQVVSLELTEPLTIISVPDTDSDCWECEPLWHCGLNRQSEYILSIDYLVISRRGGDVARAKVTTIFQLTLGSADFLPVTDEDFEAFVLFGQLAMAHARALFAHEARNSPFAGDLLPIERNQSAKDRLAVDFGKIRTAGKTI
jgi:hypothetical protein